MRKCTLKDHRILKYEKKVRKKTMADVCKDKHTVFRPNLLRPRTSSLSSGKSDIVRREAMNFSSTASPARCEADLVFGKRLQHPSS